MKLLTLNTHSLQEEGYQQKLEWFTEVIVRERPDILALQEVSQTEAAPPASPAALAGFIGTEGETIPIRRDNHAVQVAGRLRAAGLSCSWTWLPAKLGYDKYDEGLALFALGKEISETDAFFISGCTEYQNWKNRKALGIRTGGGTDWFYTVHMGWWQDEEEPFLEQWKRLSDRLNTRKAEGTVWLLGDFNSPAQIRGQGYDRIQDSGWQDTYVAAEEKDGGNTVEGRIDGWMEGDTAEALSGGMRIDQIWCSRRIPVRSSRVLWNGKESPRISDHFGILAETAE